MPLEDYSMNPNAPEKVITVFLIGNGASRSDSHRASWMGPRRNVRILMDPRFVRRSEPRLKGLSVGALIAVVLLLESDHIGAAQG
jgi:hypothetical protein